MALFGSPSFSVSIPEPGEEPAHPSSRIDAFSRNCSCAYRKSNARTPLDEMDWKFACHPNGRLATFRRKISDFWIVADEVRKARPAALAAGVI
jgi:hypothetical protein